MNYETAPKNYGLIDDHNGPSPLYFQGNTNECAIFAQWNILRDYGINVDEKCLVEQAKAYDLFSDEGGTPVEALGKLLELNGVPCDMMLEGNRYNLMNELAQGKRVIVTVDSSELWRENGVLARLWEGVKDVFGSGEDHAVVVSGIDTSDPDNIQVVLTDSGTGHRTISYPIDQFEDAWADGGCKMIVTRTPPPAELHLPSMEHFDYDLGHIFSIGNTDFDSWQEMHADDLDDATLVAIEPPPGADGALPPPPEFIVTPQGTYALVDSFDKPEKPENGDDDDTDEDDPGNEPASDEPSGEEPAGDEPAIDGPSAEDPASDDPAPAEPDIPELPANYFAEPPCPEMFLDYQNDPGAPIWDDAGGEGN